MINESHTPGPELAAGGQIFATTRWSVVAAAGAKDGNAAAALGQLCEQYWESAYVFLRRRGHCPDDAADLAQGFFARMLEKGGVEGADPERGRFRAFLLGALKHFVSNERDRQNAVKRGGRMTFIPIDLQTVEGRYACEPADPDTPESAFLRRWALGVIEAAHQALGARYRSEGKGDLFDALAPHLAGDPDACAYKDIGTRLGLAENAVKVAAHRLRSRYRDLVRAAVRTQSAIPPRWMTKSASCLPLWKSELFRRCPVTFPRNRF